MNTVNTINIKGATMETKQIEKVKVIAEIGENHVGDWKKAKLMIEQAARAGADIIKFQSYRGEDVVNADPEKDWFTQVEVPNVIHFELKQLARDLGSRFMSAPFSLERATFLVEELKESAIKVASSEITNFAMLDYLNEHCQTIYLSTGMSDLKDIQNALTHLAKIPNLYILHCTTQYPCPLEEANLSAITTLQKEFPKHRIGYSDHTIGIQAAVTSVALGAKVIEKHFTLDKNLPGTDHVLSVDENELKLMINQIRDVELLLGSPKKEPTQGELSIQYSARSRFKK
jgi:N,N'-diacetyllegionaminate synthase